MSYLRFVSEHRRFLAFGFAVTFFSSFGQTFFIALSGEPIRADFELSHGEPPDRSWIAWGPCACCTTTCCRSRRGWRCSP